MKDKVRFWTIAVVIVAAVVGLHLLSEGEAVPLNERLSKMPLALGAWRGRELELEPRIVKSLRVDDYLNRSYQDETGQAIGLYIGYYNHQKTGTAIHSPKNCLPGAGWQPVRSGYQTLLLADGTKVPINLYLVEKGLDRELVLYWYESHGRIIASEYWAKVYMVVDGIRTNHTDSALVRIVTPVDDGEPAARERALAFAGQVLDPLARLLPK